METPNPLGITSKLEHDLRPYVRWWWFSMRIDPEDIDRQIRWAASEGFGGVEIAWVYPFPGKPAGPAFLSPEWTELCVRARRACDMAGIGCDFTFGTLWPFGGSFVAEKDSSKTWKGYSTQRLGRSWELAQGRKPGRIIDHLSRASLAAYARIMGRALAPALVPAHEPAFAAHEPVRADFEPASAAAGPAAAECAGEGSGPGAGAGCIFCDSWEVDTEGLWTDGFGESFRRRYGYDILPFMDRLDLNVDLRYDYRALLSEYVLREFYGPFTEECHKLGAASRVQCHGAPADLLDAYASVDVPESEAVLFDPEFGSIAASSALLSGKKVVSSEAFTCLYGWNPYPGPAPREGEERLDDLKITADAMLAGGINHFVWHGMPFQVQGEVNHFYAGVHVGPDSRFEPGLADFNRYLGTLSAELKRGRTYARVACLYPFADSLMAGELPPERRKPSAQHYWEMQHLTRPVEALAYGAVWINSTFLARAEPRGTGFCVGGAEFEALHVDSEYIDSDTLRDILRLAEAGVHVVLKREAREPGTKRDPQFAELVARLGASPGCCNSFGGLRGLAPILSSPDEPGKPKVGLPPFWVRRDGDEFILFIAHPASRGVGYPLRWAYAEEAVAMEMECKINLGGTSFRRKLSFDRAGSLLFHIKDSTLLELKPGFDPYAWLL